MAGDPELALVTLKLAQAFTALDGNNNENVSFAACPLRGLACDLAIAAT